MAETVQQLEQLKKSIISDYDKGIRVESIIQSIGSRFLKKMSESSLFMKLSINI